MNSSASINDVCEALARSGRKKWSSGRNNLTHMHDDIVVGRADVTRRQRRDPARLRGSRRRSDRLRRLNDSGARRCRRSTVSGVSGSNRLARDALLLHGRLCLRRPWLRTMITKVTTLVAVVALDAFCVFVVWCGISVCSGSR